MGKRRKLYLPAGTIVIVMLALSSLMIMAVVASQQSPVAVADGAGMHDMTGDSGQPAIGQLSSAMPAHRLDVSDVVTVTVGSGGLRFSPDTVVITAGATVRWVWAAGPHTVTSGSNGVADNLFCSPNDQDCSTSPGSGADFVYEHTFAQAGVYPYFCQFHGNFGMTGTVTVNAAVTTTGSLYMPTILK